MFDDGEMDIDFYVCDGADGGTGPSGSDGSSIIITTSAASCGGDGGYRFTVSYDDDNDGLADRLIGNYTICNGADGQNGQDGQDGEDGNSDGVYEFYFANGFDDYSGMIDAGIFELQPTNSADDEVMDVAVNAEGQHINALMHFPGVEKITEQIDGSFYITEAILYVRAFTNKAGNTNDNWLGVKAIVPEVGLFDETKATWLSPDGDGTWTNADNGFSDLDAYDFSDMQRVAGGFDVNATIPLLLDRSQVTQWLDPDRNRGLALEMADDENNNQYRLSIYSSENKTDAFFVPTLYIKAKIGSAGGRTESVSDQEYKTRWKEMSYEEKLAPYLKMKR